MNEILIKWEAPDLVKGVSAIAGALFVGPKVHKFILPANEVVKTGIERQFDSKDFIVIRGTLPSGEVIQRTVDPSELDQVNVVTIGNENDRDEPLYCLDSLLGNFNKSLPHSRELMFSEQITGFQLFSLEPVSRNGLSLSQNDCPSPNRHFKVKVPDLLLRCPAARLSNPFGFRFPHAFRFAPARAGSLPKTRCLTPVRQSQPFLGSPLPFRAFRTLPDQSVQSDSRP
jgi:hypothetical protein